MPVPVTESPWFVPPAGIPAAGVTVMLPLPALVWADHRFRFPLSKVSEKIAFGLDTVTVVPTALLQLPARSWTRRLNRTVPGVIEAVGTEATAAPFTKFTETRVPLPTPGSVVPVQNSAVWNAVSAA